MQGSQQIWVAALWYWGWTLNGRPSGFRICHSMVDSSCSLDAFGHEFRVCISYASWTARRVAQFYFRKVRLNFSFHLEYYRQTPPKVPHFLKTLVRRKLVLWFLVSEVLRIPSRDEPFGLVASSLALYIPWAGGAGPYLGMCNCAQPTWP